MTTFLLDVNVLLALFDPTHVHFEPAQRWFGSQGRASWATCPLTENGFVRIASHPRYPQRPGDPPAVIARLRAFCADSGHQFWSDDVSITAILRAGAVVTDTHVTDLYLLALSANHGGKLATFDRRIPASTIVGGPEAVAVIPF